MSGGRKRLETPDTLLAHVLQEDVEMETLQVERGELAQRVTDHLKSEEVNKATNKAVCVCGPACCLIMHCSDPLCACAVSIRLPLCILCLRGESCLSCHVSLIDCSLLQRRCR